MADVRRALVGIGLLLAACGPAAAGGDSEVSPDRPDLTNSPQTVPFGALQVEAGVEYARSSLAASPAERRLAVQAALRVGVAESLEVRLEGEPLVRLRGAEEETDHGDLTLGVKYRFRDAAENDPWPALGVQLFAKLPLADAPIGSERADFGVIALASLNLPRRLTLDLNAGLAAVGQVGPGGYLVQGLVSASLGHALTERVTAFAELFFASRRERDGHHVLGLDTGVVYLLTHSIALDLAAGTSLTGRGPDYVLRGGSSVRFGR